MKYSRTCPKCGGTDILVFEGHAGPYGSGNNIISGLSIFSVVGVNRYVCCQCGFVEEWVSQDDIERLKKSKNALQQ